MDASCAAVRITTDGASVAVAIFVTVTVAALLVTEPTPFDIVTE